jgi:hypothetical protein
VRAEAPAEAQHGAPPGDPSLAVIADLAQALGTHTAED